MSDVQFEENNYAAERFRTIQTTTPTLVRLILKTGMVKDETTANYVLVGIATCAFLLSFMIIRDTLAVHPPPNQNVVIRR